MVDELPPESLRKECDAKLVRCETTQELRPLQEIIGQERAVRALKFGLGIRNQGFNIYVAGYPGTGRKTAVKSFVEEIAQVEALPSDWCYVNNFANPYEPKAIQLPAGKGRQFRDDMKFLIDSVKTALPKAFESEDYAAKREATIREVERQRKELIDKLNVRAQQEGFIIQSTPVGLFLIPVVNGHPLSEEELLRLPPKMQQLIQEKRERLEAEFRSAMRQFIDLERKIQEALKMLNRDVALYAIGNIVEELIEKYKDMPEITSIIVETIDPAGPYGAKEAGMSVAMSAAQAYCNAVGNALGIYFNHYPLTPERILDAIEHRKTGICTAWEFPPARKIEGDFSIKKR